MKVYEVHYDNMEQYEDNFNYTECVFSTYEGAVEYLEKEKGLVEDNGRWERPMYICSMNNIDCIDCERYYDSYKYNGMKFVDEDGEESDCCPEVYDRENSEWYRPEWSIIEWEVR